MLGIIFEVVTVVISFIIFGWALLQHCKKPRVMLPELASESGSNVVSIHCGKQARLEKILQSFLDAEDALARNESEKYLQLRMQALEAAKSSLSYRTVETKRVS